MQGSCIFYLWKTKTKELGYAINGSVTNKTQKDYKRLPRADKLKRARSTWKMYPEGEEVWKIHD